MNGDQPLQDLELGELETLEEATLPGRVEAIPPVVERIMRVVRSQRCADSNEFEIELALTEALANAVKHGCRLDPAKTVQVRVLCDPERGLVIVVRDPGDGFDLRSIHNPLKGRRLYASHGRGIFLISTLMDEVQYQRGGSEIWMRKGPGNGGGAGGPSSAT